MICRPGSTLSNFDDSECPITDIQFFYGQTGKDEALRENPENYWTILLYQLYNDELVA